MNYNTKAVLGWTLPGLAIPALPMTATLVPEPSTILIVGVMIVVALAAAFVGNLFDDEAAA